MAGLAHTAPERYLGEGNHNSQRERACRLRRHAYIVIGYPLAHLVTKGFILGITISLRLGRVHALVYVVRRGVDGEELERYLARINDIVVEPRGNHDDITGGERLPDTVDDGFAHPSHEDECLFDVMMNLRADFSAGRYRHQYQLRLLAGVNNLPEITVGVSRPGNVHMIGHRRVKSSTFWQFGRRKALLRAKRFLVGAHSGTVGLELG